MTVPETAVRYSEDTRPELIRCKKSGCGQVLAAYTNAERTEFKPLLVDWWVDKRGRIEVRCPNCGERNRLDVRRRS